jgi:hypothetical protein
MPALRDRRPGARAWRITGYRSSVAFWALVVSLVVLGWFVAAIFLVVAVLLLLIRAVRGLIGRGRRR